MPATADLALFLLFLGGVAALGGIGALNLPRRISEWRTQRALQEEQLKQERLRTALLEEQLRNEVMKNFMTEHENPNDKAH